MTTFLTTRVDDIPLVVGAIRALQLATILDTHLPTHGNTLRHNALTNGEAISLWLTFVLTQGNHRKWKVQDWVAAHRPLLEALWGAPVPASDFSDDRLTTVAAHLARPEAQQQIDAAVQVLTMRIYQWGQEAIRLDGTRFAGYHQVAQGVMQYGFAKEAALAGRAQCQLLAASTETGQYLTGHFHPGNRGEDPLYRPVLADLFTWSAESGLLFLGDSKMGALATRALISEQGHYYYLPLADSQTAAAEWARWTAAACAGELPGFHEIWREDALLGYGFTWTRPQPGAEGPGWTERVQFVRSLSQVEAESKTLVRHLTRAEAALRTLTPPPRQKVTPYTEDAALRDAITAILTRYRVQGLFDVQYTTEPYQGRSKKKSAGGTAETASSPPRVRYVITRVQVRPEAVRAQQARLGWRIFVTNAPPERLPLAEGFRLYRRGAGQGIERMNRLLKDHTTLGLDRLFVTRDDQICGIAYLVTLALRVMMDIEVKVRQGLAREETVLVNYSPNTAMNARPTTKTMLERVCFYGVTLLELTQDGQTTRHVSELPAILQQILRYLDLPPTIYTNLSG